MASTGIEHALKWFKANKWEPFEFQKEAWHRYDRGENGIINAPTGSGKTYSLLVPIILGIANEGNSVKGLRAIWITPIRALAKEIEESGRKALSGMGLDNIKIAIRTGDTTATQKKKIINDPPHILITTPESLHLMMTYRHYTSFFKNLKVVVADEWHELMGSKRGVQVELALSRLRSISGELRVWGISATIGNMEDAATTLLGPSIENPLIIRSEIEKKLEVISILPDHIDSLPWAGHLGIHLIRKIIPLLQGSQSSLVFTNTRSQCEIWYRKILEVAPDLAGVIAMHHSAISKELRNWVEDALHDGTIKVVVCTSSLDLGVDFRPVETIVQIGSPKGIARFMQRAGRSGHQPGAVSKIYFVPTHTLELIEAAALRSAIQSGIVEERIPYRNSYDVLIQYLITIGVAEGFRQDQIWGEIKQTMAFRNLSEDEWDYILSFVVSGGKALDAYDEFHKMMVDENEIFRVSNKQVALRHRMSIGTIVGDSAVKISYKSGQYIGTVEEYFISRLNIGDVFWFAGRSLELVGFKGLNATVRNSKKKAGKIPSWQGGRMSFSAELSKVLRDKLHDFHSESSEDPEIEFLRPLIEVQNVLSVLPTRNEFLIEYLKTREGYHIFMYPFESRTINEGIAALTAYRISRITPITFSIAMNDYGFELLSDTPIPIHEALETDLFSLDHLSRDIEESVNSVEMARRRFRDIAAIAGLVFKGYPGRLVKDRHIQSSAALFFNVFQDYEPENLLFRQAYEEVAHFQLEESRMRRTLERINQQKIILKTTEQPTPFCFPIMVDGMRERLSTERLEDRIDKLNIKFD